MKTKIVQVRTGPHDKTPAQIIVPVLESVRDLEKAVKWSQKITHLPRPSKDRVIKAASDGIQIMFMCAKRKELKQFE